jgi:hypothetical protein
MRTVQTVGLIALAVSGCASGKSMPSEQAADASEQTVDSSDPEVIVDARPDATPPDAPPDACVPVATEKLANPVFDLAPDGVNWTAVRNAALIPIVSVNPTGLVAHSAPNKAWFGGASGDDIGINGAVSDSLHQDFAIPATATTFVVSGYFLVGGVDVTNQVFDTFSLDVIQTNGTVIENVLSLTNMQNTNASTFAAFSKTLTANVAGQTVRLRATSTNDVLYRTSFWLDSLSFKATHCAGAQ